MIDLKSLPATRAEALATGSKHYFTGKKCINGHLDKRYTLSSTCVSCRIKWSNKWQKSWRDKKDIKLRHSEILSAIKTHSKNDGVVFNLTVNDIVWNECCPILGIPLDYWNYGSRGGKMNSPSLDKLIPSKGYIKGNVCVISRLANIMKLNFTKSDVHMLEKAYPKLIDYIKNS